MDLLFQTDMDAADLSEGSHDVQKLIEFALKAGNGTVRFENGQLDRRALLLNPFQPKGFSSLKIPCLVGKSSVNNVRLTTMTNPFTCSEIIVIENGLVDMKGLFGLPLPFYLDSSCEAELFGGEHLPPQINLQRVAKWILWNVILGNLTAKQAEEMVPTLTIPLLQDEIYSKFPFGKPNLVTAHVRANRLTGCSHSLSVAMCGTNDTLAAETLNDVSQPAIFFLAGDTLANSSIHLELHPHSKIVLAPDLYPLFKVLLSKLGMTNYTQFIPTYGDQAEKGFFGAMGIVMDQILLGCGELLGTFYKTHRSTFSNRASVIAQTIGYQVCLPRYARKPMYSPELGGTEIANLYRTALEAGVDSDGVFRYGNESSWKTDPIINPVGCSLKGSFLKPLHFTHRWQHKDLPCHWCGPINVP